jgi:mono/diheme cytochrome c family protein
MPAVVIFVFGSAMLASIGTKIERYWQGLLQKSSGYNFCVVLLLSFFLLNCTNLREYNHSHMNNKFLSLAIWAGVLLASCGNGQNKGEAGASSSGAKDTLVPPAGDESKGVGKFKDVQLTHPLDQGLVEKGKTIYDVKCGSCHKLTTEKLVGPGWKGVTDRRKPEWIMNFVTNTDEMLDKDPNAKALVEVCMVRMPNQHLNDDEARQMLEFMRNNDGKN